MLTAVASIAEQFRIRKPDHNSQTPLAVQVPNLVCMSLVSYPI